MSREVKKRDARILGKAAEGGKGWWEVMGVLGVWALPQAAPHPDSLTTLC